MAKMHKYEVRPRGNFMFQGIIVQARNPELAMLKPLGGNKIGSVVIETTTGDWWLISAKGFWSRPGIAIDNENIHPYDPDPHRRMLFAKICEKECQSIEEIPNMEFSNFTGQLKQYKKIYETSRKKSIAVRKQFKKEAKIKAAECKKECVLADSATYSKEKRKAKAAISTAQKCLQEATKLADASCTPGDTKPNSAMVAVAKAKTELDRTIRINKAYGKNVIPENQVEMFNTA